MWNKRGQIVLYSFMLGLVIIVVALALAPAVMQSTNSARNVTDGDTYGLDCSNSSISSVNKVTCYAADLSGAYFLGFLIFLGGAVITAKIIFD